MANLGSVLQTPRPSQSTANASSKLIEEPAAQFLELRTDAGPVYVRPSRWQRVRLQWTFRHFHVLAPQVLSRGDRRLVAKLSRSAVVTPAFPMATRALLGVVENAPFPAQLAGSQPSKGVTAGGSRVYPGRWGVGALATVGSLVILVFGIPLFSSIGQARNPGKSATPIAHLAQPSRRATVRPTAANPLATPAPTLEVAMAATPTVWATTPSAPPVVRHEPVAPTVGSSSLGANNSAESAPSLVATTDLGTAAISVPASPAAAKRQFVSELPQSHFVHPAVSDRSLVGELQLKALIGSDGSVSEVTVLSGSPKLAEAGMRAVRQWHYRPYDGPGGPVEREAHIKMSFFGEDAVSVTSVAKGTGSDLP